MSAGAPHASLLPQAGHPRPLHEDTQGGGKERINTQRAPSGG